MKSFLALLLLMVAQVFANTEAFFFKIPNDPNLMNPKSTYEEIKIDEINNIEFTVPSPNSKKHSYKWFEITDGIPGAFHNARISWSALDPIQIIHFDFETVNEYNETGLFLYLETKYNCYTNDHEFMKTDHEVEARILISSTYLYFIPVELLPTLALIISLAIVGFSIHGYVYQWLEALK